MDLSGIPLTPGDLERVASYLRQRCGSRWTVWSWASRPHGRHGSAAAASAQHAAPDDHSGLNGNRLTRALLRDLTDALRRPQKVPQSRGSTWATTWTSSRCPSPSSSAYLRPSRATCPPSPSWARAQAVGTRPRMRPWAQRIPEGPQNPARDQEHRETIGATQT